VTITEYLHPDPILIHPLYLGGQYFHSLEHIKS
jgi:hypothetical protein